MLEKTDLTGRIPKSEYKEKMPHLEAELGRLQRECRALNIPVLIVFEGFGASGKGLQIGRLIHSMDPRGFRVFTVKEETEEERMHPFLWRFWTKTPARGRIAVYDGSWNRKVLIDRFDGKTKEKDLPAAFRSIRSFERQLSDDGNLIIKLFLHIDRKEQKKRFQKLEENSSTAWRVSQGDRQRNNRYEEYASMIEDMLRGTDADYAPWTIIGATDNRSATVGIYTAVIRAMAERVEKLRKQNGDAVIGRQENARKKKEEETAGRWNGRNAKEIEEAATAASSGDERSSLSGNGRFWNISRCTAGETEDSDTSVLSGVDLSLSYTREEYEEKKKKLQKKLAGLHEELYLRRIPVVIGFEGWDAAGKGGAIRRLTEKMDARGYDVNPTAAPNDIEKEHHYLWRFWRSMPKDGHVAIFDRTWYGRVLVERIEGLCTPEEWKRAYREINDMERDLSDAGAVIIKFWLHIDRDEQERRFRESQENPEKRWKITAEDWRNREKWDQYEDAVSEMFRRTSTKYAPWVIVEGNCKYYARIKVLRTVVGEIEKRMGK